MIALYLLAVETMLSRRSDIYRGIRLRDALR